MLMFSNNTTRNDHSDDDQYFKIIDTPAVWDGLVILVVFTAIELYLVYDLFL